MANASAGSIRLFVLGDARIETPKGEIEPTAEIVFAAALYLILERREPVSRKQLTEILWPGVKPSLASHRMRQTLLKLRQLGFPAVPHGKSRIALASNHVVVDYSEFVLRQIKSASALLTVSLELLPSYAPQFSPTFLEWLDGKRTEMSGIITRFMLRVIAKHRQHGEWADLELATSALLVVAPYNEEAILALAESLAMRGSKLEGIHLLDSYLADIAIAPSELRVQATLLRKRIANQTTAANNLGAIETPLVGRSSVLRELSDQLQGVRDRKGKACLVLGEAGIGKSRLVKEFITFATLQGFSVHRVQCRASHKNRPFFAFIELVPSLRMLRGAIGCSPDTLSQLDRLTQYRSQDHSVPIDARDSQWVYGRVLHALFDIIDAVADETPLLVQIEDVHWLDETSSEVLADMIAWAASRSVLFMLTGRTPPALWVKEIPEGLQIVGLQPLGIDASQDLVHGVAEVHGRSMDNVHLEWCVRVAEGNPYFLQELATHWVESGSRHDVPPSLLALLGARADRLDRDDLQVLQACALLENHSTLERLEQVLRYEPHKLLHSINSLGAAGMVVVEPEAPNRNASSRIVTKHELLSTVALQRLTPPARIFLHRRIGLILEQEVDPDFATSILWDCAKHWQLAGDSQRALSLALSCAKHLMKVGLSKEAGDTYERCLPFCISDNQRLEVLEGEALAHYAVSDWQRLRETAALAKVLKERLSPHHMPHDDLELMDLRAEWQSLKWDDVARKALNCLNAKEAPPRHRVEGGIMAMMLLGFHGSKPDVANTFDEVQSLIKDHNLGTTLGWQAHMVFHTSFGNVSLGVEAARELVSELQHSGNVAELFRSYCNSAVTYRVAGLFTDADCSLRKALDLACQYGLEPSMVRVLPMLANNALEAGRVEDARQWYARLSNIAINPSDRFGMLEFGGIGARLALLDGDGWEANRRWPMTRDAAQQDHIYHRRSYNCALQIAIDLAVKGAAEPATLQCLIEAYHHSKSGLHQTFSVCVLYAALTRQGDNSKAEALLSDYVTHYRREPWPIPDYLMATTLCLGKHQPANSGAADASLRRSFTAIAGERGTS